MAIRNILAPISAEIDPAPQLDTALYLARRLGAAIDAVHVRPNPAAELASLRDLHMARCISYEAVEAAGLNSATAAHDRVEAWRQRRGVLPQTVRWSDQVGFLEAVIERRGRLSDLLVLRRPMADSPCTQRAFDAGVFATGRPCLLVGDEVPDDPLHHVIVGWNGSLEGTRAIVGAMPMLETADHVSVFQAVRPDGDANHGADLVRALASHTIDADGIMIPGLTGSVGAALLKAAAEIGATMLVMGGYTHSRIRQQLFGGVTRHVLAQATIPVLMAH